VRGSLAAAIEGSDGATAQFVVNLADNTDFDATLQPGYTVFGRVKEGLAVFDEIGQLPTGVAGPFAREVPTPLIAIQSIARTDEAALAALPPTDRELALERQIVAASEAGDHAEALRVIGHYRALCGTANPALTLIEAQGALAQGDRRRAALVLEEYFATNDAAAPNHEQAIALYRQAAPEVQASAALVEDCPAPSAPALPDGTVAPLEEMVAAQTYLREFVATAETHLACLATVIDDAERDTEERNAAVAEHNRIVAAMETAAAGFNEQVRRFKGRE